MRHFKPTKDRMAKALVSVPQHWRQFYLDAPKEVTYDYIIARMPFDEFIAMSERTWLFDWVFIINHDKQPVKNDMAYKEDGILFMNRAFVSAPALELYNALPETFTTEEMRRIRLSLGIPIRFQDQLSLRGHFFRYECNDPYRSSIITHYWKTPFKPVLK